MHTLTGVIVPADTTRDNAHERVEPLMRPWCEEGNDDGWWDWFQVGGRYTGRYSEYDPAQDEANYEKCYMCDGTGTRTDGLSGPGNCNVCCRWGEGLTGTGRKQKWPTEWRPCPDDVVPVKVLVNNPSIGLPLRLVFPDGSCSDEGPWEQDGEVRRAWDLAIAERLSEFIGMALVVVDIHS